MSSQLTLRKIKNVQEGEGMSFLKNSYNLSQENLNHVRTTYFKKESILID